ncbi:uncharacterized protein LOC111087284 [Limulus polyphemus]|uniref:Uncharacterized protein LOC111087284 n=1 Tax=Limulus polyphemus TaxID=6850 RepID=A0ABM1SZQ6_LIMPO|nr:uncharacterized protein LOC111087284 [Limulus polyphemus]
MEDEQKEMVTELQINAVDKSAYHKDMVRDGGDTISSEDTLQSVSQKAINDDSQPILTRTESAKQKEDNTDDSKDHKYVATKVNTNENNERTQNTRTVNACKPTINNPRNHSSYSSNKPRWPGPTLSSPMFCASLFRPQGSLNPYLAASYNRTLAPLLPYRGYSHPSMKNIFLGLMPISFTLKKNYQALINILFNSTTPINVITVLFASPVLFSLTALD